MTEIQPLFDQIKEDINDTKQGKGPEFYGITFKMINNGGENVEMTYHKLLNTVLD